MKGPCRLAPKSKKLLQTGYVWGRVGVPARKPLCYTIQVKLRLQWRPQDVRNARTVGCMLRKEVDTEWS